MSEISFLLRTLGGLAIAVITGFVRRLYCLQDLQNEALRELRDEQIRSEERLAAHKEHTQKSLDETTKRLERIEDKLDHLPGEIAAQIRRESEYGQMQ